MKHGPGWGGPLVYVSTDVAEAPTFTGTPTIPPIPKPPAPHGESGEPALPPLSRWFAGLRSQLDRRKPDPVNIDDAAGSTPLVGLSEMATRRNWVLRVLWAAVAMGPLAILLALVALNRDMPEPLPPVPVAVDVNAGVGGWAENYVATYLSADSSQLSAVRQFFPDATRLPADAADLYAVRTATIRLQAVADGVYEALVSADVLADIVGDDEGYVDAGTRYYTVGVVQLQTGFVATSLPSQVAAPPTLSVPNRVLPELSRPDGAAQELATALDGFFAAYLAADGELSRYADLSAGLVRVDPAPFLFVKVAGIAAQLQEPGVWLVQVEVLGTADSGSQRLHYTLEVLEGNRWEVAEILPSLPHLN